MLTGPAVVEDLVSKYQLSILLVDQDKQAYDTINHLLAEIKSWQCTLEQASSYSQALAMIEQQRPDICLLNPTLSDQEVYHSIQQTLKLDSSTSLILFTQQDASDATLETMEAGAIDYLAKDDLTLTSLKRSIQYALRYKQLEGTLEKRVQTRTARLKEENEELKSEVSKWKGQEESRRQSEQHYRGLFDIDIYGVEVLDGVGNIVECNTTFQKMLGYTRNQLIGQHTTTFASEADRPRLNQKFNAAKKDGYAEGEIELTQADGTLVLVWRRMRAITNEAGEFNGVVVYSRDITERMKAVRQISTLARALEQSPTAILITDGDGEVEYLNFRFTELTGYTYEETVGLNLREIKSFEEEPELFKEMWETINEGDEWYGEFHNISEDGEAYWEALTIAPMLSPHGTITHFVAAQEDITERKNVEEEFLHTHQRVGDMMTERISDLTSTNEQLEREINERKRVEKELKRSRARLKAQYKGIPLPTYSWQQSGENLILVDFNDVAERDSDGRIAEFLGKTHREVFKDTPQVIADFDRCMTKRNTVIREAPYQLITTGEIKYYVTTYNFVPPNLVVVHIQDVTKQRAAEEKLAEYDSQANTLSMQSSEVEKIKEALQQEIEARKTIEVEFKQYRKEVEKTPKEHLAELDGLKNDLQQEILKREQLEKALQESEERFQQVAGNIDDRLREQYRSIPVPTYSWQRIAGEFVLIDFNDAAAESMGKIVDFFGKKASEIFENRPEILKDFEDCYQKKEKIVREAPYKMITTGETRYFVTTYNFVPPNLVIDHIQDITEQKQLEDEIAELRSQLKDGHKQNGTGPLDGNIQEEIKRREEAERELYELKSRLTTHRDELEDVVKERTFELTEMNKQLQREIFEHQRAEESLKEARARLRAQYKGIPIPTYSWRKVGDDFVLIDYNHAAELNSNGRMAQFMSKPAREIFKDRPQVLADFSRCYNERKSIRRAAPYRLVTTGEMKHFVTTYNFAPPNVIIVYIQDVTEQKNLEVDFQKSIAYLDLKCRLNREREVTFVNDAYYWYYNIKPEDVLGQKLPFVVEQDKKKVDRHIIGLNRAEPAGTIECNIKKPDQTIRQQRWTTKAIFDKQGHLVEYRISGKDITLPKEIEG